MEEPIDNLMKERIRKIEEIRKLGINPYPYSFKPTHRAEELQKRYDHLKEHEGTEDKATVAGRIMSFRRMGKAAFSHIMDGTGQIQIYFRKDSMKDSQYEVVKLLDIGDFIGVQGKVFKTKTGELSIFAESFQVLSKGIRPLPEKFHGLKDQEIKYRQRYLDFMTSPEARKRFRQRARIIREIRNFLDNRGFIEFETPVLQPIYGGASAKPFVTHHNALDMKLYLKISPELYLKRLIVGGFEKVYDLSKNFRNEGIDYSHNPEFTMLELYEAYSDYNDMMDLTEELVKSIARNIFKKDVFQYRGHDIKINSTWERIPMQEAIEKHAGIDVGAMSLDELKELIPKHGLDIIGKPTRGLIINALFETLVEEKLIQPTFIIDYPEEICPLTKIHRKEKGLTERFELFIAGQEWANAYSELNDPKDQRKRLEEQEKERIINDEAHPMDEDFVQAIEYCMPPTGGLGIGVDRLVMLFTGTDSIKEVIAFPTMKAKEQ
jgi:lysyl-tRNA synthetase class 2